MTAKFRVNWTLELGDKTHEQGDVISLTAEQLESLKGSAVVTPVASVPAETKRADQDADKAAAEAERLEAERIEQERIDAAKPPEQRAAEDGTISAATGTKVTVEGSQKSTSGAAKK